MFHRLGHLLDCRGYTTGASTWYSVQHAPLERDADFYGSDNEGMYCFIYPNTMLNCLPGRMQTNRVIPLGVDRCRVEFDYYYPRAQGRAGTARQDQDRALSDEVQRQDMAICEAVQRGLASGSFHTGRLSPEHELGLKHFHDLLRRAYGSALQVTPSARPADSQSP